MRSEGCDFVSQSIRNTLVFIPCYIVAMVSGDRGGGVCRGGGILGDEGGATC